MPVSQVQKVAGPIVEKRDPVIELEEVVMAEDFTYYFSKADCLRNVDSLSALRVLPGRDTGKDVGF